MKNLFILSIVVILALLISNLLSCNKNNKLSKEKVQMNTLIEHLSDSIQFSVDRNGVQTAIIEVIEIDLRVAMEEIVNKDKTISWLNKLVRDNKKANDALVAEINTVEKGSSVTIVEYVRDTSYEYIEIYVPLEKLDEGYMAISFEDYEVLKTISNPIYSTKWDEEWSRGEIVASRDSFVREIEFINRFEVFETVKKEGKWWWNKQKVSYVNWTNLNPYSSTKELRKWKVSKSKTRRFNVGLGIGYGFNLNNELKLQRGVNFGLNANYKLFSL